MEKKERGHEECRKDVGRKEERTAGREGRREEEGKEGLVLKVAKEDVKGLVQYKEREGVSRKSKRLH